MDVHTSVRTYVSNSNDDIIIRTVYSNDDISSELS